MEKVVELIVAMGIFYLLISTGWGWVPLIMMIVLGPFVILYQIIDKIWKKFKKKR